MATRQVFVETWADSAEYAKTAALLEKAQQADEEAVIRVNLEVRTLDQDGNVVSEYVHWSRQSKEVEE